MNVGIGTETTQFLFWEYINFGTVWAVLDQKTSRPRTWHSMRQRGLPSCECWAGPAGKRSKHPYYCHRLNMKLDLESLFGLHVYSCTQESRPPQLPQSPRIWALEGAIWSSTLQRRRKFEINIPREAISGPQSQFPHSCVCSERIIYSHDGSACSAGGNM